jgi:hypothetical protein
MEPYGGRWGSLNRFGSLVSRLAEESPVRHPCPVVRMAPARRRFVAARRCSRRSSPLVGAPARGAILRLSGCSGQDRPQMQGSSPGEFESGDLARDSAPITLSDGRRRPFQALRRLRGTDPAASSLTWGQSCPAVPDKRNLCVRFSRELPRKGRIGRLANDCETTPAPAGHCRRRRQCRSHIEEDHERLNVLRGCRVFEA